MATPGLSRVGVTNVEQVMRLGEQLYLARLDCVAEGGREDGGERFGAVINDVIARAPRGLKIERLAERMAVEVRERLAAVRAEVRIAARYPEHRPAPVSGIATQEIYTLFGAAAASERGARRLVGVAAQGMTATPRAVSERLAAAGFDAGRTAAILAALPPATDGQRGFGTLHVGVLDGTDIDAAALLAIVEASMSSEIYELMKRADEAAVVEKATRRPRRAEDCVRAAILGTLARYDLADDAFLSARQEHFETLRRHHLVVERFGLIGELRRDSARHTTLREWLSAA